MKRFMIAVTSAVRIITGLFVVLIMLAGLGAAIRKLWEWARSNILDETFLEG